ncbi:MAG: cytochrome c biogenesis CcdA family protein [Alphaproteobacteria bacterium]
MLAGSLVFAFAAGVFSTLSPCVLPILPLVLGAAVSEHRWGPAALAGGLALSFTVVGLFIATVGFSIGLDAGILRNIGAVMLIGIGLVLIVPQLSGRVALAGAGFTSWAGEMTSGYAARGIGGQFLLGGLLGAIWVPCVGPTLGAASLMAAQGENLLQVSATMLLFGVGAALPLLGLGLLSREAVIRWRGRLGGFAEHGKALLGFIAVAVGMLVLTGLDKRLEAVLVAALPEWLIRLTTQF